MGEKITQWDKMSQYGNGGGMKKRNKLLHRDICGGHFFTMTYYTPLGQSGYKIPGCSVWSRNVPGDVVKHRTLYWADV